MAININHQTDTICATGGTLNLTGYSGGGAGFSPDADENLIAGTAAGASVDGTNSCFNIFLGACAGNANVAGANNVFLGNQAGRYTLNASNFAGNIIIGNCAGQKFGCDSGDDPYNNVIIGTNAGRCTDMNSSVLIGNSAGCCSGTGGQFNTFVGAYSGLRARGSYNSYFGFSAGRCNNGGSSNVMIGVCAGQNMTGGDSNVFVGKYSGRQNTGKYNSAFGRNALLCKTAGDCNIALGACAFRYSGSLGHSNIALGQGAGCYQEGDCNVIIGAGVTSANSVTGSTQLAIGIGNTVWLRGDSSFNIYDKDGNQLNGSSGGGGSFSSDAQGNLYAGTCSGAASDADTSFNVAIGQCAACTLNSGDHNVFLGFNAGRSALAADANILIGKSTGCALTNGDCNVFLGVYAGRNSTTGCQNIFLGKYASGYANVTGNNNVSIGCLAGSNLSSGASNVFLGKYAAGSGTVTGSHNIAAGTLSGNSLSSGSYNVFFGACAGKLTQGASHNIFLGRCAGCTNTSGTANIAIGKDVVLPSATGDAQFAIGCGTNRWIYGDSSYNIYDKDGNQLNGGGGVSQNLFRTIAVSGQSDVVADSATDTLTLVAGSNMTITTDANTDTITFASSGSGGSSVSRQTFNGSTSSTHADDADESITITAYKSYSLLKLNVSHPAWVRIYPTTAARTADASRTIAEDPTPGSGVIAEAITTTNNEDVLFTPALIGFNDDSTPSTNVYLAVMNKTGGVQSITVTMTAIQMES